MTSMRTWPPRTVIGGGAIVFLSSVIVRLLTYFQALDYIRDRLPNLYCRLVGPTVSFGTMLAGVFIMFAGYRQRQKERKRKARTSVGVAQQTQGTHSPTFAATDGGTINVIGAQATPRIEATKRPVPNIVCRGNMSATCELPYFDIDDSQMKSVTAPCNVIAFRNDVTTSDAVADNVVAHLDFYSDADERTPVNEGWWREDTEEGGVHTFYIANSETKHLIIVAANEQEEQCYALDKRWVPNFGRHMPMPVALEEGHWRLKIELTAENFRCSYYLDGEVFGDGSSRWSSPLNPQPSQWDIENR